MEALVVPDAKENLISRSLPPAAVMQALRGIWKLDGDMIVLEVDQEMNVLIASTYEGQPVDPKPVIQRGVQVQTFEAHRNGS
jgi:hypothetical protein